MTQQDHTVTANMNRLAPAEERIIGPKNDTTCVSPASIQHFTIAWGSKHIGRLSPPVQQLLRIEAGPSPRTSQRTDKWRRTISDRKLQIINTQTLILRSIRAGRITVQHADGMKATLEVNRFRLSIQLVLDSVRCTEKDIRMAMEIKLPSTA